ncbi:MAG: glutamyl-tRNA reductase [Anaerolineae bacterium]
MTILLVGLSHRTAPVELRERLSLSEQTLPTALQQLPLARNVRSNGHNTANDPSLQEVVIVSTCNRLEVYAITRHIAPGRETIEQFLSQSQNIPLSTLKPHLYFMHGQDAVVHLMRVASGLDSMILGEAQILGQVSTAFHTAQQAGTTGAVLSHLFAQAIHAGKRARTETAIGRHSTSVSHAAAVLAREKLGVLDHLNVLLIGAGEMAKVAAQALFDRGARQFMYINRTFERAWTLAEQFGGEAVAWHDLPRALTWADVVVSATGAPHTIVHAADVREILPQREQRPLVLIDIAVPRDIEEAAGNLPGITRYDIDDLQSILDENMAIREAAVPAVEQIILEEAQAFSAWLSSREVAPVIKDLRQWATEIAEAEVEHILNKLDSISEHDQHLIELLAHRIVNKLLHEPTTCLRAQAANGNGYAYAHVVRSLFALSSGSNDAYHPPNGHHGQHEHTPLATLEGAPGSD